MKQINPDTYEPIMVYLTPDKTPIAYENKVKCLLLSGTPEEEAKRLALEPIELELYYEIGHGLFAVESEAVECGITSSPYTRNGLDDEELDETNKERKFDEAELCNISQIEMAYDLKAKIEETCRCGLIEYVTQNGNQIEIPKHDGEAFALDMLGMEYKTFFFTSMAYDGETLSFSGSDEDGECFGIDEDDLPDNGLLYLLDYIVTGTY